MLVARIILDWVSRSLTQHSKVYFFMLNSAPKGPQATAPEISQNVADILRLHEGILLEMKGLVPDSHLRSAAAAQQQSKHPCFYSNESAETLSVEPSLRKARFRGDFPWVGTHRNQNLVTMPREAADIAKVFDRMV